MAAGGLLLAALLLWIARRPIAVALGFVLLLVFVTGGVIAEAERQTEGRVSPAELRTARTLRSETGVRELLGPPAGSGSFTGRGFEAECATYVRSTEDELSAWTEYLFCFEGGRVVARWPRRSPWAR
jgi:hypothetical protein